MRAAFQILAIPYRVVDAGLFSVYFVVRTLVNGSFLPEEAKTLKRLSMQQSERRLRRAASGQPNGWRLKAWPTFPPRRSVKPIDCTGPRTFL